MKLLLFGDWDERGGELASGQKLTEQARALRHGLGPRPSHLPDRVAVHLAADEDVIGRHSRKLPHQLELGRAGHGIGLLDRALLVAELRHGAEIWIAVCVYVLIAIVKKRLSLEPRLYTILQLLSVTAFEKMPLDQLLSQTQTANQPHHLDNQLNLFGY
jgi:hypothetical protein